MKSISFLLGSGFSRPASYPTTGELNERLKRINASEICIHTSGDARFLDGETDPNAEWMGIDERKFVEEFLEFYSTTVLGEGETFHYETFYDYYQQNYDRGEYQNDLARFIGDFLDRCEFGIDGQNLLMNFNHTFNQLIAQLLWKDLIRASLGNGPPNYQLFLRLVESLAERFRIHFHTLNHDLFMEYLAQSDCITGRMDDGFEELGSPFYGEIHEKYERYKVRLKHFTNRFDKRFCLYKLHGSIDFYWFQDGNELSLLKTKRKVSHLNVLKEIRDENGLKYVDDRTSYYPDFLTGTSHKTKRYEMGGYYPKMFQHFARNLRDSRALIVIGYGFGDSRINDFVKKFARQDEKVLAIIDISQPNTEILELANVHYIGGGVSSMDLDLLISYI